MRLRHADRKTAIALFFPKLQLIPDLLVRQHLVGSVDALGDGLDLVEEAHLVGIDRREIRGAGVRDFGHLGRELSRAFRAQFPMARQDRLSALLGHEILHRLDLGLGVRDKVVDRNNDWYPEGFDVLYMPPEVRAAL